MFTGLVQRIGALASIERRGDAVKAAVRTGGWEPTVTAGESIAVQGVCMTVTACRGEVLEFDMLDETYRRTSFSRMSAGAPLNLERALRVGDAMGGHYVSGHVDGTGTVRNVTRHGRDRVIEIVCAPDLLADVVSKGSIACDGVSLTVVDVGAGAFTVHVIPFTWEQTSLGRLRQGDAVNLETDLMAKYARKALAGRAGRDGVTWEKLSAAGFADQAGKEE